MNARSRGKKIGRSLCGLIMASYMSLGSLKAQNDSLEYTLNSRYNYNLQDLKHFNRQIDFTFEESKEHSKNALIIDKAKHVLYLIECGTLSTKYNIELGYNQYDDKKQEGDGCTPEGLYEVIAKKDIKQTIFYRAFLINYPNGNDVAKNKTGSYIEIHGEGSGKKGNADGQDWTWGCVAMSNEDIDKIFQKIELGCRVTIVKYSTNKKLH